MFRGYTGRFDEGTWKVPFCGRTIKVPLQQDSAWLDWDAALSVLGHETEIKRSYEFLIQLSARPRLILDIGANYGTHSILFLVHGIRTISFEPNAKCHKFFQNLCSHNGVPCPIEPLAVGRQEGVVELWFPETEEWLGTIDPAAKQRLESVGEIVKVEAGQTTVDEYIRRHQLRPDLIKIDTEGNDLNVLLGSLQTLAVCRPLVIFESWQDDGRMPAFEFLAAHGYRVCNLPIVPGETPEPLTAAVFSHTGSANFLAVAEEMLAIWPPEFA